MLMNRIINACSAGVRQGDKEQVLELIDSLGIDINQAGAHWNNFTIYKESEYNRESGIYEPTNRYVLDVHRNSAQVVNKGNTAYVNQFRYAEPQHFDSFNDYLNWVSYTTDESVAGMNAILKKISIATAWYTDRWGLRAFTLRKEVGERQNNINEYLHNEVTIYGI